MKDSKAIAILGSTGSVGCNTLDVIARNPADFHVVALAAQRSVELLLEQCQRFQPKYVVLSDAQAAQQFKTAIQSADHQPTVLSSAQGLEHIAALPEVDTVMAAIVGAAGLPSTLAAAKAGKTVLLANKEALVMSGELLIETARHNHARLLPIDSEHNAVFQCMQNHPQADTKAGVAEIILTASGGPFLTTELDDLKTITPEQACKHPNWRMGKKISVDSATMMNKGLELIEACLLFGFTSSKVSVLIHPQSIIHALVAYQDGSMIAHMGYPDMRVPIAHALAWPQRISSGVDKLDLTSCPNWQFQHPDMQRFPCLALAMRVQAQGQSAPTVMNAANEVAVQAFLDERIAYPHIYDIVAEVVAGTELTPLTTLESILAVDADARGLAQQRINELEN